MENEEVISMTQTKISRRKFVAATALGAGGLAMTSSSQLFAGGKSDFIPTVKNVWAKSKESFLEFVKAMPEDKYGFKPTAEVMSFAEQVLHTIGGNYWFFATLKGEKPPKGEEAFKAEGKTKADIIKIVEEADAYADEFFNGLTEKIAHEEAKMGENTIAKWKLILFGLDHITHHRGQLVVYLRLNGIKPPQYRSGYFG
jgi:uncharacterized damage-inducible protein DinB